MENNDLVRRSNEAIAANNFNEQQLREKYGYNEHIEQSAKQRLKKSLACNKHDAKKWMTSFLPIIAMVTSYKLKKFIAGDIISGITIAIIRIPQSLAYGMLAGLNPVNGMYTAFLAPLVYVVFGTSRHLSVGTFSVTSLMLGAALDKYLLSLNPCSTAAPTVNYTTTPIYAYSTTISAAAAQAAEEQNLTIITSLTLLTGLILIILGILQMGFIAVFLSDPLVSGFTTSSAIYVLTTQLKSMVGIPLQRRSGPLALIKTYIELFSRFDEIVWAEVIVSVICFAILIPIKQVNRTYKKKLRNIPIPVELFVVIVGTVISANVNLPNVNVVGPIPSGLPKPYVPPISLWSSLITDAFSIAIVIFAMSASLSKLFAKKHGYDIDANQDLFALGLCQFTVGFLSGHACAGALARSSVQESSGGNTQVAGVISSIVLLVVLLVIGPLFQDLPRAVLSTIIIVNLHGLFMQFQRPVQLWKINKYDFSVWIVTFVAVIFLGVDLGLGVGIVWSLAVVVVRTHSPKLTVLGRLPGTDIYKDIFLYQQAEELPGIKILQFPQSPTYVNKAELLTISSKKVIYDEERNQNVQVANYRNNREETLTFSEHHPVTHIVLDCSYWGYVDSVALSTLEQVCMELKVKNISVIFCTLLPSVMDALMRSKIMASCLSSSGDVSNAFPSLCIAIRSLTSSKSSELEPEDKTEITENH